jgi:hypothetical protein
MPEIRLAGGTPADRDAVLTKQTEYLTANAVFDWEMRWCRKFGQVDKLFPPSGRMRTNGESDTQALLGRVQGAGRA